MTLPPEHPDQKLCASSVSPLRALEIGLSRDEVCAWYKLTRKQLKELTAADDIEKCSNAQRQTERGCLMTQLLERPDMPSWAFQTIMRRK